MRHTDRGFRLAASVLLIATASPVAARGAGTVSLAVPAGSLDRALATLAAQAGIDVGGTAAGLSSVHVEGVRGRLTPAAALARLLRSTPFRAIRVDPTTFRLAPRPRQVRPRPPDRPVPAPAPPTAAAMADIVVRASKTAVDRLRFPGALTILDAGRSFGNDAERGVGDAATIVPVIQETALGSGRNKLFIRGIADSSFGGPTQSTSAVYWGDTAAAYTGADPNLNLYDVDRIEVLEGPQGTLYGAGAIGGVIRVVPRRPDLSTATAAASIGLRLTRGAAAGSDLAGMVNVPLVDDRLAVRAIGYRLDEGGYVDDVLRGLRDVNGVRTRGGRLALRAAPAGGWTVDAGLVGQRIRADDLQYAERRLPGLARASALAQPFRQDYRLAQLRAEHLASDDTSWVTAVGHATRDAQARFDATRARPVPIAYDTDEHDRFLSVESRVSKGGVDGAGWLVGTAFMHAEDRFTRRFGRLDRQRDIVGTANRITDASLFAQGGIAIDPALVVTLGARITRQRSTGEALPNARASLVPGRTAIRVDPTLGANWRIGARTALYARYQSGFRAGGVVVTPEIGQVAALRPDTIAVAEAGLRHERQGPRGVAGTLGVSAARWRRVQADLVARAGFPFTTNLGDSRILGVEATGDWVPLAGLTLSAAVFANRTRLMPLEPSIERLRATRLPNTPALAAAAGVDFRWRMDAATLADLGLDGRYVGASSVGSIAPFDLDQGGYATLGLRAGVKRGRWHWRVEIDNLLDAHGDRFAAANPFTVTLRDAYTPLRPRAVRLGVSID